MPRLAGWYSMDVVAELKPEARRPLSPWGSGHANDLGGAEGREAVHLCDADLDFSGLPVWVPCADALAEGLEAAHPIAGKTVPRTVFWSGSSLDPTSDVVAGPLFPERPAIVSRGRQGLVSGLDRRAILFPEVPILAGRDDGLSFARGDGGVAAAGVTGPVRCPATVCLQPVRGGGHGADLFTPGDLVQPIWQNRAVTVAAGGGIVGRGVE